jgi:hypothetical protein
VRKRGTVTRRRHFSSEIPSGSDWGSAARRSPTTLGALTPGIVAP